MNHTMFFNQTIKPTILVNVHEPWPHPWAKYMTDVHLERANLEGGDFVLAGVPDGAAVKRKTVTEFIASVTRERKQFTRELNRAGYRAAYSIVVEGAFPSILSARYCPLPHNLMRIVAEWQRRGFPMFFAGTPDLAALFTMHFLTQQLKDAERLIAACRTPITPQARLISQPLPI